MAGKNPYHRSSYLVLEVHNDQACIQVRVRELLSDLDIRMKEHETQIWGPQMAGHIEVAKVLDSCLVIIVGTANRRDKKKAMVTLILKVEVKLRGT